MLPGKIGVAMLPKPEKCMIYCHDNRHALNALQKTTIYRNKTAAKAQK
jgi:hypothetical protein